MSDIGDELRAAYEDGGYDVADVSVNRGTVRVVLLTESADVDELRRIANETVADGSLLGLDVTTERDEGRGGTTTVVSFRHRT